jgi:hypothetical protein
MLAMQVASRLGVPAGPLLDSRWTTFAARMGFDILTYKTIRTQASTGIRAAHCAAQASLLWFCMHCCHQPSLSPKPLHSRTVEPG